MSTVPAGPVGAPAPYAGVITHFDMQWVSRYSRQIFDTVLTTSTGAPLQADDYMTAVLYGLDSQGQIQMPYIWTRTVVEDPDQPGHYPLTMSTADTQVLGNYELQVNYTIDGIDEIAVFDFEIGHQARDYDALIGNWKGAVDAVWGRFSDLFDSPYGGPNLQVYVQTHFGRNRLAQLLPDALGNLNMATLGHSIHSINDDSFNFTDWASLLHDSLYVEVLKHLQRSYVEQPEAILGTAVSRVDRRDYMQRWGEILAGELADFNRDLGRYKMANLGLGNVHVLVSGGAYGKLGPYVNAGGAGEAAARGYFAVRRWH